MPRKTTKVQFEHACKRLESLLTEDAPKITAHLVPIAQVFLFQEHDPDLAHVLLKRVYLAYQQRKPVAENPDYVRRNRKERRNEDNRSHRRETPANANGTTGMRTESDAEDSETSSDTGSRS